MNDINEDEYLDIIGRIYPDKLMLILEQDDIKEQATEQVKEFIHQSESLPLYIGCSALAVLNFIIILILLNS